jgi:DNA polymerase-3 subunit gamma/tau
MAFEDVVGQEHVTYTLRNALASGRVAHAYLFAGPRGTGKTTMARLLAKAVNCRAEDPLARPCNQCDYCIAVNEGRFLDLIEIDAASHTGVDDVRELRDRIAFAPNEGQYKVYIVDEVHRFSGAAFDALLKTIEEPPPHAIFVLATTESHKVPQTILSRCQRFEFRRLSVGQITRRLYQIVEAEGLQADASALELIARLATGSLRDAISLLDQLLTSSQGILTLELAQAVLGTTASESVQELTVAIVSGDTARGLDAINQVVDTGVDPRQLAKQVVDYLRLIMLVQAGGIGLVEGTESAEKLEKIAQLAEKFARRGLLSALEAFNEAALADWRWGWQPQLPLEMAFLKSVEALHGVPQGALVVEPHSTTTVAASQPSQAPPAFEVPPPEPAAPDAPSLAEVHSQWERIHTLARQKDPALQALLLSSAPYKVEGHTVVLEAVGDFVREKIEKDENRRIIEAILQQVFKQPLKIRCQTQIQRGSGQPSPKANDLLATDEVASFMVNELGGKIKHIEGNEEE